MRRFVILGAFLFTGLAALAVPEPAAAVIRYVTADGTDSGTCGTLAAPCRSITQGIARAGTSDHILVGPGHYGPVVLSKAVTLESSAGAAATVITDPNVGGTAVRITAVGALFGTPSKGFTVLWGRAQGPGPDPGDASCVTGSGAVDTVPFLTKAVAITTQTGR